MSLPQQGVQEQKGRIKKPGHGHFVGYKTTVQKDTNKLAADLEGNLSSEVSEKERDSC